MKRFTKSQLAITLSKLKVFDSPKDGLEQYPTDSEIAAEVLFYAYELGDIEGKKVFDLGCGTGILGIGCLLLGAERVFLRDIDDSALAIAKENYSKLKSEGMLRGEGVFELGDVSLDLKEIETIVMNPPFGTRKVHADKAFIGRALGSNCNVIYSFHKSETLPYWRAYLSRKARISHEWVYKFPLKATRAHHRRRISSISVAVLRIEKQ